PFPTRRSSDLTLRKSALAPFPPFIFKDELKTYDLDLHHRFFLGDRHEVLWGAGYRMMQDEVENPSFFAFLPVRKELRRFNAFLQDEITLLPGLKATLGTKSEHEDYSGYNLQPAARAAWSPDNRHTLWGAVSRAVRTPSRIDVEFFAPPPPVPPGTLNIAGGPDFGSESLVAYELGYRHRLRDALTFSAAAFYNVYGERRSSELDDIETLSVRFRNGSEADSRGVELSGAIQAVSCWSMRGGYTYLEADAWGETPDVTVNVDWNDPAHQFSLFSMMDLPAGFQLNLYGCYVDELPDPVV